MQYALIFQQKGIFQQYTRIRFFLPKFQNYLQTSI